MEELEKKRLLECQIPSPLLECNSLRAQAKERKESVSDTPTPTFLFFNSEFIVAVAFILFLIK